MAIKFISASIRFGSVTLPIESISYSDAIGLAERTDISEAEPEAGTLVIKASARRRKFRTPHRPVINRLRKYIRRNGNLVSVRTRGRTGYRTVEEATEAAS